MATAVEHMAATVTGGEGRRWLAAMSSLDSPGDAALAACQPSRNSLVCELLRHVIPLPAVTEFPGGEGFLVPATGPLTIPWSLTREDEWQGERSR